MSHTKGPWTIRRGGGHKLPSIVGSESVHTNGKERNSLGISSASYSDEVCEIFADLDLPTPAANARLIAAAPDLLEACKQFVDACKFMYRNPGKEDYWFDVPYRLARAAIEKAEGRK